MSEPWLRDAQADLASTRILTAAGQAFVDIGVGATTMSDIARYAGCSRATLYRYFENRRALHLAYIDLRAREISQVLAARTASITDPGERLTAAILGALELVRARPDLMVWFEAGQAGFTARLSGRPELVHSLTTGLAESLRAGDPGDETMLGVRLCVRMIVSLLTMPGEDPAEERAFVSRFIVPGLMARRTEPARH